MRNINESFLDDPDLLGAVEDSGDASFSQAMFNIQNEKLIDNNWVKND